MQGRRAAFPDGCHLPVGGPADGFVFVVPPSNVPRFVGVGYPISPYEPEAGNGDVRIYRYVSVN
jgi:hypothetical protein